LEEVAGHAAFYADPTDPRDIADAIFTAMSERRTAAEAGIAHARGFSWDRCAAETEEVYLACR
jgi:glycosyltransferase involved in cell wall biosynthesis